MTAKVEPALFMFMLAYGVTIPLRTEYLKDRFITEAGLPDNDLSADCHINKSDPIYPTLNEINDKTAYWSVYLAFMISLPALFTSNYLCAVSDHRGRKLPMHVTVAGLTIYALLHLTVIAFDLSLHLLALASFILGCSGDFITFMSSGFAYVADTTSLASRIWRIVLAESLVTFAGGPGQIGVGYLVEASGFEAPYVFILACLLITSLYLCYLPESVKFDEEKKGKSRYNPKEVLADMRKLLRPDGTGRLWKLLSYNAIIFVYIMNAFGFIGTSVLYVTSGNPFCFSHREVGFYEAAQFISAALGMLLGGAILPRFISDLSVIHISNVIFVANLVLTGIVTSKKGLYIATIFGLVRLLAVPLARARMSKMVRPSEQGVMFALSGCVQSLATMVGIPALQAIFPATNALYPGLVFIIMAACVVPPEILTIFLHVEELKQKPRYEELSAEEDDSASTSRQLN